MDSAGTMVETDRAGRNETVCGPEPAGTEDRDREY
jgi:hypothetical protein